MRSPIKIATEFLSTRKLIEKSYGAVIGGSHIRGGALPGSDIDLFLVYKKNFSIEFADVHSQLMVYKGIPISLITESKSNVESLLRDKDPSVISFFIKQTLL